MVILPYGVKDTWLEEDSIMYINEREMLALTYFVCFIHPILARKHVVFHTDSKVVYFCLKKMGSFRSLNSDGSYQDIMFEVRHFPGKLNVLSDSGSRYSVPQKTVWTRSLYHLVSD